MNFSKNILSVGLIFSAFSLLFWGCDISDSDSNGNQQVAVKMRVQQSAQKITAKQNGLSQLQSVDSLTQVKMLVEELELESSLDADSLDFEVDDLVVNLPLDGSDFVITSADVPEGVYDEFEMEIENDDDTNVQDPDFNNPDGDDYTVIIKGIYNGAEFTYRSEEDFELELELSPALEVSENSSPSVAININPASWFKDSSGNDLDPNDPNNRDEIDDNIEQSFDVEQEDDDDDDDDDDGDDDDSDDDDDGDDD